MVKPIEDLKVVKLHLIHSQASSPLSSKPSFKLGGQGQHSSDVTFICAPQTTRLGPSLFHHHVLFHNVLLVNVHRQTVRKFTEPKRIMAARDPLTKQKIFSLKSILFFRSFYRSRKGHATSVINQTIWLLAIYPFKLNFP